MTLKELLKGEIDVEELMSVKGNTCTQYTLLTSTSTPTPTPTPPHCDSMACKTTGCIYNGCVSSACDSRGCVSFGCISQVGHD